MPDSDIGVILYVEYDPLIREALLNELREAGFAVREAVNGADALAAIESGDTKIRGLITDVNFGRDPDGWTVAKRAREQNPSLPVIYVSGETQESWAANGVPNSVMIEKPFVPTQVVVAIAALLNNSSSPQ